MTTDLGADPPQRIFRHTKSLEHCGVGLQSLDEAGQVGRDARGIASVEPYLPQAAVRAPKLLDLRQHQLVELRAGQSQLVLRVGV